MGEKCGQIEKNFTLFNPERLHFVGHCRVVLINKFKLPYWLPSDKYTREDTLKGG